MKRGRKPNPNKITEINFNTFKETITEYKRHISDCISDDEEVNPSLVKFTQLPVFKQNIFIIYVEKQLTVKALANLLNVNRTDLLKLIKEVKKELCCI